MSFTYLIATAIITAIIMALLYRGIDDE